MVTHRNVQRLIGYSQWPPRLHICRSWQAKPYGSGLLLHKVTSSLHDVASGPAQFQVLAPWLETGLTVVLPQQSVPVKKDFVVDEGKEPGWCRLAGNFQLLRI